MPSLEELRSKLGAVDLTARFDEQIRFRVPTGNIAFDLVIGGGIPSGRLTEFFGGESSSKSRLLLHILAETQKMGGIAMLLDTERSVEKGLADLTGLDVEELFYIDPNEIETLEQVFDKIELAITAMREVNPDGLLTFGLDSLAAIPSKEDMDRTEWGVSTSAMRRARVIGDALKKLMPHIYQTNICLIFTNQIRDRMNVQYGAQTETPGGRQVKFWAALRLQLKIMGAIKNEKTKEQIGSKVNLKVAKSKVCVPFQEVNFEIPVSEQISRYSGLLDYMVRHEQIEQTGARYKFPGEEKTFYAKDFIDNYKRKFEEEE